MEIEFSSVERLSGLNAEILKISLVNVGFLFISINKTFHTYNISFVWKNPRAGRTLRHIRFCDFAAGSSVSLETIAEVLHLLRYVREIKKIETGIDRIALIHGLAS